MESPEKNTAGNTSSTYNETNIKILEGLEAVRKRPGMYLRHNSHGQLRERC